METLEDAVFQLYCWRKHTAGSFSSTLFELISIADMENLELIREGFPSAVQAYILWMDSENEESFFKKYVPLLR